MPAPRINTDSREGQEIRNLFSRLKDNEGSDGSWNGADVVDAVTCMFAQFGVSVDSPYGAVFPLDEPPVPCRHCPADIWKSGEVWQNARGGIHCGKHAARTCTGRDCAGYGTTHAPIRVRVDFVCGVAEPPDGVVVRIREEGSRETWYVLVDGDMPQPDEDANGLEYSVVETADQFVVIDGEGQ